MIISMADDFVRFSFASVTGKSTMQNKMLYDIAPFSLLHGGTDPLFDERCASHYATLVATSFGCSLLCNMQVHIVLV